MNENQPTQPTQPAPQHVDAVEQPQTSTTKTAFWRRKPVWITAIVVGSLALGGAGAAYAMDEFDDDDRSMSADGQSAADAGRDDDSTKLDDSAARGDSDARDAQDADDVPLTDAEYTDASDAALAEAKGGTVTDVDRSDDPGVAFEVDVLLANGDELEVDLGADFSVVRSVLDPRD